MSAEVQARAGERRRTPRTRIDLSGDLTELVLKGLPQRHVIPHPDIYERRPRIGVVFGAGGVLGNAYLSGVMAAIHGLTGFEPRTATALVGTSAGAVHAALYGAGKPALFGLWRTRGGLLPEDFTYRPTDVADEEDYVDAGEAATLREIFAPARALPKIGPASKSLALKAALRPWAYRPEVALSAWLPEGVLTNDAIGRALRGIVRSGWVHHPRTWITAVNLRTGQREVFGRPGTQRAHLDRAVRASTAIPGLYRPVRIGRDRFVDGGIHSPSNADLLAGMDLDLVVVINPMSSLEGHAASGFVDRYLYPLRRMAGRRLDAELRQLHEDGTPVLVLQPVARDLAVFSRNLMDPRPRRQVAERAVETTLDLLSQRPHGASLDLLRLAARARRRRSGDPVSGTAAVATGYPRSRS
jgi:NTE family protein